MAGRLKEFISKNLGKIKNKLSLFFLVVGVCVGSSLGGAVVYIDMDMRVGVYASSLLTLFQYFYVYFSMGATPFILIAYAILYLKNKGNN